jgi:hypothetical protein
MTARDDSPVMTSLSPPMATMSPAKAALMSSLHDTKEQKFDSFLYFFVYLPLYLKI